jgi:hypothetical protein
MSYEISDSHVLAGTGFALLKQNRHQATRMSATHFNLATAVPFQFSDY